MRLPEDRVCVLTREASRQLDELAVSEYGLSRVVLMENAGAGAAVVALEMLGSRKRVTVACGPGMNGGDGYVIARHLHNAGCDVTIMATAPCRAGTPAASNAATAAKMKIATSADDSCLSGADLIVDALLGTGLDRAVTGAMQHTIEAINESNSAVLAVDLPSGLDSDTGSPLGDAVRADATATFACWKRGFLELESLRWTGEIYTIDIGAPQSLCERLGAAIETATRHGRGG